MELVILLAQGAITFSDTNKTIQSKLKGKFSDSEIDKCLYDLYIDLRAKEHRYELNLRMLYDRQR